MGPALPLGDRAMARSCVGRVLRWSGVGLAGVGCAVGAGCAVSPGFRRSCQFWSTIAPFVLEHSRIKARARYIDGCDDQELDRRTELSGGGRPLLGRRQDCWRS